MNPLSKIAVLALVCVPLAAPAEDRGGREACRADVQKFCAQAAGGGGGKAMDCLLDHQKEISDGCYDALKARLSQQRGNEVCRADVGRFCNGVEPGGGRIVNCLVDHQQEISEGCYESLKKQKSGDARGGAEPLAEGSPPPPARPVYRTRQADGRTVYSDVPPPSAGAQREVPMDRVISAQPMR